MTSSPLAVAWSMPSSVLACGLSPIALAERSKIAAAFTQQRSVVVAPRRACQSEKTRAFVEAGFGIGVGIEKDVLVIERAHELGHPASQQAVAKHIA